MHEALAQAGTPVSRRRVTLFMQADGFQARVPKPFVCTTDEGWLYLAVLLDLATRRAVGWAVSSSIDTALVSTAFARAGVADGVAVPDLGVGAPRPDGVH